MAAAGMQKARKYDLGNTNIGMLGSDLEKKVKLAAAQCEDQWKTAGKSEGIQIWRIEQFKVVPWPKDKYGKFFSGDSYIILNTYKKPSGGLAWNAHFWIGDKSSQDEYGTAAYKTVELDDYLGGAAVQYREVQGKESRTFKKLFKNLIVMEGGVDSGFNHVKPLEYRHRLLHVKGKMNIVVREVPIALASLNSGDSFVYDGGLNLLVWHGKEAAPMEKTKATALAQAMSDERGGKVTTTVLMEGMNDDDFFKCIGQKGPIKTAAQGGDDEAVQSRPLVLLRVSDASGKIGMTEVAKGTAVKRSLLSSADVFVLDDGAEVIVWVGKGASKEERKQGLSFAAKYLQQANLPKDTPISSCMEGGENEIFESAFENGVLSTARPGEGVKFTGNIDVIRGKQTTKAAADSVSPTYAGSGGPGVVADMDALYAQKGTDPADWKGRTKPESEYAKSLGPGKRGSGPAAGAAAATGAAAGAAAAAAESPKKVTTTYAGPVNWTGPVKPTLTDVAPFDAKADAQALRAAMKGLGTNEAMLIHILCHRSTKQRLAIRDAFKNFISRDLEKDLSSETSGNFCTLLKALVRQPAERDAKFIFKAVKGLGTDDTLLIELISSRESKQIIDIKSAYQRMFPGHTLEKDVAGDTSGHYKNLLLAIIGGSRADPATPVDQTLAETDARAVFKAGEYRLGTDEKEFIEVFSRRSFPQLKAMFEHYPKYCKHDIRESVARETSFNFRVLLQAIIDNARSPTHYYARRLYKSMEGAGTHDLGLIFLIIDRAEIDLGSIIDVFPSLYGKQLTEMIRGDTSGDYRKALLALCGEHV